MKQQVMCHGPSTTSWPQQLVSMATAFTHLNNEIHKLDLYIHKLGVNV